MAVVRDRNRFTGGITAGIDFGLTRVAEKRGDTEAQTIQLIGEYDPAPPFDSGSPSTARKDILAAVSPLQQPLCDRIRAFGRTL